MPTTGDPIFDHLNALLGVNYHDVCEFAEHIKKSFFILPDFNIQPPDMPGYWYGYLSEDKNIGCIIVEDDDEIKVCALADFKNNTEIVLEVDPDGFGDNRLKLAPLTDAKLYALRPELIPGGGK